MKWPSAQPTVLGLQHRATAFTARESWADTTEADESTDPRNRQSNMIQFLDEFRGTWDQCQNEADVYPSEETPPQPISDEQRDAETRRRLEQRDEEVRKLLRDRDEAYDAERVGWRISRL